MGGERGRAEQLMAESQLVGLQNMPVLLEETRLFAHNLAYHRRAKIEARLDLVLFEVERQIEELRGSTEASIRDRKRLGFYGIPARSVLTTRRRLVALPPSAAAPWL